MALTLTIVLSFTPGTDKLYITHSEWASEDAFSANAGAGVSQAKNVNNLPFKRLPYNFCALSLQPFSHPVCTAEGTTFELTHILPWIKKHGTNPVDGKPLKSSDLVRLNFAKNEEGEGEGEYVDPVTYKPFTNNTHMYAPNPRATHTKKLQRLTTILASPSSRLAMSSLTTPSLG